MQSTTRRGSAAIIAIIVVLLIVVVGFGGYKFVFNKPVEPLPGEEAFIENIEFAEGIIANIKATGQASASQCKQLGNRIKRTEAAFKRMLPSLQGKIKGTRERDNRIGTAKQFRDKYCN